MAGTTVGGLKTAERNKAKDPEFYVKIGAKGGSVKNSSKGFGSDRERARIAGAKGGAISRRGKTRVVEVEASQTRTLIARIMRRFA